MLSSICSAGVLVFVVKASPLAACIASADDVFGVDHFVLSFPTGCLGRNLGLNCVSSFTERKN